MTTSKGSERTPKAEFSRLLDIIGAQSHSAFEGVEGVVRPEDLEELSHIFEESHIEKLLPGPWDHHAWDRMPRSLSEPSQVIRHIESRLDEFEKKLRSAIDIGLENRKLLEQLHEGGSRIGLGAIHSLSHGQVQLAHPLLYSYQVVDDQVMVGIEEFGIYGVGSTEVEAVGELQEELWSLVQDLERTPPEKLGPHLTKTLRALKARIPQNAMDA